MKVIGYTRVSTKSQLDNNSLEQQKQEILSNYSNAIIYKEQGSGKSASEREVLQKVLSECINTNEAVTLVCTKLDRLARNTVEGIEIIEQLFKHNVKVHVLNVGLLENTTMGKFFLTTMLAVAEMERSLILERMQAGKEIARQNPDYREGRKNTYTHKQILFAAELKRSGLTYKQVEERTGICKQTLIRRCKKNNIELRNI